jgi:hypothetical protein
MTPRDVEELCKEAESTSMISLDRGNEKGYFWLPPMAKASKFIAILYPEIDLNGGSYRLRIEMVTIGSDSGMTVEKAIEYRFESPGPGSIHDYHHAQLTSVNSKDGVGAPNWLPDGIPCMPVPARNPITGLFAAILSLYGIDVFEEFLSMIDVPKDYRNEFMMFVRPSRNIRAFEVVCHG